MSNPPLFVAAVLVFVTIVVALTEAMKKEYQDRVATALATAILDRRRPKKRMIVAGVINDGAPPKRKRKSYDRNRARLCIQSDYIGPNSTFCDDFHRIFRITRSIYDRIKSLCMREDPFFRDEADCCGAVSHSVDAKLLIASKGAKLIAAVDAALAAGLVKLVDEDRACGIFSVSTSKLSSLNSLMTFIGGYRIV